MVKTLVIAPHPDDETLGCGGTLLRHKSQGNELHWLIVTAINEHNGWSENQVQRRKKEIDQVGSIYGFNSINNLSLPSTRLDTVPFAEIVEKIGSIVKRVKAEVVFVPFLNDVHTDHQIIAKAANSCTKWYRFPLVNSVLSYETLSETNFSFSPNQLFKPNVFNNISKYIDQKIEIMKIFNSELGEHPFPRSEKVIRALATLRGSQSGFEAAEAFELLYERR